MSRHGANANGSVPGDFHGDFRDPCMDIERDVSALLDSELDQAGLRRVLVHLEICPKCRGFLDSIRAQVTLHQGMWKTAAREAAEPEDAVAVDPFAGDLFADVESDLDLVAEPSALQQSIFEDVRERIGEVLYQLGRAYIILARSPATFRIIAREPVPVPEYLTRGKALLDGVSSVERDADIDERRGWREARELLDGRLDGVQKNFDKGRRLLEESLAIRSGSNAARILLGQVMTESGDYEAARAVFESILADPAARESGDPVTHVSFRVYALESLGNLHLCAGDNEAALHFFEEVRASDAMRIHDDFSSCLLNIAVTSLRLERFDRAAAALEECYRDFPSRREPIRSQLVMHRPMLRDLERDPATMTRLAASCPLWFGDRSDAPAGAVSFHLESFTLRAEGGSPREDSSLREGNAAPFEGARDRA